MNSALTIVETREIAESIVGKCEWDGETGYCLCPGIGMHSGTNARRDFKVVVFRTDSGLAPGCYCYHGSCAGIVEEMAFKVRSALGKRTPSRGPRPNFPAPPPRPLIPKFDPEALARHAAEASFVTPEWLPRRSKKQTDNMTPASFLHELYEPGERVIVFNRFRSQGQRVWTQPGFPYDASELDLFRKGARLGVWFLNQPVTGEYAIADDGKPSRRAWQTVTSWRYLVLESDDADPAHWLSAIAQAPIPIAAISTSAGKSIHALVRVDAASKAEWDDHADFLKPLFVSLGADRKAMSAVRLTRLPCCERLGKMLPLKDAEGKVTGEEYVKYSAPRMQQLLYLNARPDCTPIVDQPEI